MVGLTRPIGISKREIYCVELDDFPLILVGFGVVANGSNTAVGHLKLEIAV